MGQVDGNLVQNAWSCYATYSQSTDNTTSTISITAGMRSHGYGMSLSGFWVGIDQGGYSRSSTDTSFYSSTGGWVDKDLLNYTDTWTRTHEDRTINCWAAIDRSDAGYRPGKSTAWMTFIVPAKDHWTIAYNANGGSGAPGSQTKWRDENLTLSSTKPTRTGYSFQGWATSSGGSVAYQPGASYTSNSGVTLYAIWKANTWTVRFDANGGSGAPANQTKTYGIDLTLSSTKPTRALYNFLGWATTANGTVAYAPGAKYKANADITLYAVWELAWIAPKLSNHDCFRSNQNGVADDIGTYCRLVGDWVTDRTVQSITVTVNDVTTTISGSGKAGSIAVTLGAGALSAETSYTVKLVITDEIGSGEWNWTIAATHYILDFAPNGSIGINTPAVENENSIDGTQNPGPFLTVDTTAQFRKNIMGLHGKAHVTNGPLYKRLTVANRVNLGTTDESSSGHVRIYGRIGGFTASTSRPIDIFIPTRDIHEYRIVVNIMPIDIEEIGLYLFVRINPSNKIEVWLKTAKEVYYTYDLLIESYGSTIVDDAWTSTAPDNIFWSLESKVGKNNKAWFVPYVQADEGGYPGLYCPKGTPSGLKYADFIRFVGYGVIPESPSANTSLGTTGWRFAQTWTRTFNGGDGLRFFAGSKTITAENSSNSRKDALLFTPSQYSSITGSGYNGSKDVVLVMNGNASANPGVAAGGSWAAYWTSGNIWVECDMSVNSGALQIQYLIVQKGR